MRIGPNSGQKRPESRNLKVRKLRGKGYGTSPARLHRPDAENPWRGPECSALSSGWQGIHSGAGRHVILRCLFPAATVPRVDYRPFWKHVFGGCDGGVNLGVRGKDCGHPDLPPCVRVKHTIALFKIYRLTPYPLMKRKDYSTIPTGLRLPLFGICPEGPWERFPALADGRDRAGAEARIPTAACHCPAR